MCAVYLFMFETVVSKPAVSILCFFLNRENMEKMGKMEFQEGLDKRSVLSKGLR